MNMPAARAADVWPCAERERERERDTERERD